MYDAMMTIPVTKEMQKEIKKAARDKEISMNQFCRDAIRQRLKKINKKDIAKEKDEC